MDYEKIQKDARRDLPSFLKYRLGGDDATVLQEVPQGTKEKMGSTFFGTNFEAVDLTKMWTPWGNCWAGRSWHTNTIFYWQEKAGKSDAAEFTWNV